MNVVFNGVNDNGVQYIKINDTYHCTYYFGDGAEISKAFKDVDEAFIRNLTFDDLLVKE